MISIDIDQTGTVDMYYGVDYSTVKLVWVWYRSRPNMWWSWCLTVDSSGYYEFGDECTSNTFYYFIG